MTRYHLHFRPVALAALACCLAASAACTSGSGTGVTLQTPPTPTPTSSVVSATVASSDPVKMSNTPGSSGSFGSSSSPVPGSVSSADTPSSSTTASPAEREAADRAAIETVWAQYWTTGAKAISLSTPAEQKALMSTVAVNPALQLVLAGYAKFAKNGWTDYGTVSHRPYWSSPIGGKSTAVMGDCMDDSKYGSLDVKTGKKLTVGVPRDNTRVTAVKTTGGWRIQKIEYLVDVPC